MPFFFLNECLSLNRALAYLEWLLVLQTLRGERPKTKVTPEVKKCFCQIQIIFLYSTKNGHSEKSLAARSAPFSQSLSHMCICIVRNTVYSNNLFSCVQLKLFTETIPLLIVDGKNLFAKTSSCLTLLWTEKRG